MRLIQDHFKEEEANHDFYALFSRVNLSPSPQATSHQSLNNGQKFYYQLQSSLSALSGASTSPGNVPSNNDSNASKNNVNALSLNNHNSECRVLN